MARPVDGLSLLLIAGALAAQITDVATTQLALARSSGIRELNPLMSTLISLNQEAAYLLKIGLTGVVLLLVVWRCQRVSQLRLALLALMLWSSVGAIHNLPLLTG